MTATPGDVAADRAEKIKCLRVAGFASMDSMRAWALSIIEPLEAERDASINAELMAHDDRANWQARALAAESALAKAREELDALQSKYEI